MRVLVVNLVKNLCIIFPVNPPLPDLAGLGSITRKDEELLCFIS